jgi:hypothetical protein
MKMFVKVMSDDGNGFFLVRDAQIELDSLSWSISLGIGIGRNYTGIVAYHIPSEVLDQ